MRTIVLQRKPQAQIHRDILDNHAVDLLMTMPLLDGDEDEWNQEGGVYTRIKAEYLEAIGKLKITWIE